MKDSNSVIVKIKLRGEGFVDSSRGQRHSPGMGSRALNKEYLLDDLRGLVSEPVIMAMSRVPRELFVPEHLERRAYDDTPLPIGLNQTISAPHMVAIMCELLDLRPGMKVLEVGGGSGYHAAVMAVLVGPRGTRLFCRAQAGAGSPGQEKSGKGRNHECIHD